MSYILRGLLNFIGRDQRTNPTKQANVRWADIVKRKEEEKVVHITTKRDREECVICWQGHTLASQYIHHACVDISPSITPSDWACPPFLWFFDSNEHLHGAPPDKTAGVLVVVFVVVALSQTNCL